MTNEDLLLYYVKEKLTHDPSTYSELSKPNFVSFFMTFIHEEISKIVDRLKSPSPAVKSNFGTAEILSWTKDASSTASDTECKLENEHGNGVRQKSFPLKKTALCKPLSTFSNGRFEQRLHHLNVSAHDKQTSQKRQFFIENRSKTANFKKHGNTSEFPRFSLGDFPALTTSSPVVPNQTTIKPKKQKCRRIKPTLVSLDTNSVKKFPSLDSQIHPLKSQIIELGIGLKQKSLLSTRIENAVRKPIEKSSKRQDEKCDNHLLPQPSPQEVGVCDLHNKFSLSISCTEKLSRLANLHSHFVSKRMVPSIIAEMHMLLSTLLIDAETQVDTLLDNSENSLSMLINTPQKIVHFASLSLLNLSSEGFFHLFSAETLSLLSTRINNKPNLVPLAEAVQAYVGLQPKKRSSSFNLSNDGTVRSAVPFKIDTDDRSSFQSDQAFYSFRKQRDMFYELLRQWNNFRSTEVLARSMMKIRPPTLAKTKSDFKNSVSKEAIGQIRWLISQVKTYSTFNMFLRLFVDHLLNIGGPSDDLSHKTTDQSPLVLLLNGDSEKFRLLETRVKTASPSQKSNSCDWMYKEFQFFRDFVTISDCYTFNTRLCDVLQSRICDIEDKNSQIESLEDEDPIEDFSSVIQAVHNLRILGNFYGLVAFLPYQNGEKRDHPSHVEDASGKFILLSLERAIKNGHLLLTVPWVVQFLYFSRSVFTSTNLFQSVYKMLHNIYRLKEVATSFNPPLLHLFIGTVVSTLFEQEFCNESLFYECFHFQKNIEYEPIPNSVDFASERILSGNLICEMHWRLADIRSLLKYKTSSTSKRQMPKKIKPLTEKLPDTTNMQAKLEAAFFRNQPSSLKRTVLFVSDRSHSNCVKHLCSIALPQFCRENETIAKFIEENLEVKDNKVIKEMAGQVYVEAIESLKKTAASFVEENISQCMNVLVSSTVSPPVLHTASQITERLAFENIERWLNERLLDHLCSNIKLAVAAKQTLKICDDFLLFINDLRKQNKPSSLPEAIPNPSLPASRILHNLRECIFQNQQQQGSLEATKSLVEGHLLSVGRLLQEYHEANASLPRHVTSVLSYLVRELINLTASENAKESQMSLESFDIEDDKKIFLWKLIDAVNQ